MVTEWFQFRLFHMSGLIRSLVKSDESVNYDGNFCACCLNVVVFMHLAAAEISGVPKEQRVVDEISGVAKEQRVVDAAQDVLTAAIANDPEFVSSHEGILTSQRMVTKDFSFWTTGLHVEGGGGG